MYKYLVLEHLFLYICVCIYVFLHICVLCIYLWKIYKLYLEHNLTPSHELR